MAGKILIIDGVAINRIFMKARLSAAHYDVLLATNITEARDFINNDSIDLIFIAANLPDGCGIALCKSLKSVEMTANLPVLMTVSASNKTNHLTMLEAGADNVIHHPVATRVLLACIQSAISRHERHREIGMREDALSELPDDLCTSDTAPSRVACVSYGLSNSYAVLDLVSKALDPAENILSAFDFPGIIQSGRFGRVFDVIVIEAAPDNIDASLNLLSNLRSRSASRDAGIIFILPRADANCIAAALNIGANNVLWGEIVPCELAIYIQRLSAMKTREDRLHARIRDGLRLAITDPLTGLYNRRYAMQKLSSIARDCWGAGTEFAVLILDIDHFKSINDRYGHVAGDQALCRISEIMQHSLRDTDLLARIGGEEFLIVLPDCDTALALHTAERLRHGVEQMNDITGANATLSIGVTHDDGLSGIDQILQRADQALYAAKTNGRNMIRLSGAAA